MESFLDQRDSAHNNSLYSIALWLKGDKRKAEAFMEPVKKILFKSILWPIKNPTYFWSNSDGLTKWLYNHINTIKGLFCAVPILSVYPLVKINHLWLTIACYSCFMIITILMHLISENPWKGTNPDQTEPYNIYNCLSSDFKYTNRFLLGHCLRAFFYPNGEHSLFKLSHLAPIARLYHFYPLYWILDAIEFISARAQANNPETTTKIRLYVFLCLAEVRNQETIWTWLIKCYLSRNGDKLETIFSGVYRTYFGRHHVIFTTMPYNILKEVNS